MAIIIVMLAVSLLLFFAGLAWILALKGKTTRRSGAEVGVEMMEEKMARRTRLDGRASLGRKAFFWGKGWAVERKAAVSYAEIKESWRERSFGVILPAALLIAGMVGMLILGGLLMLLTLPSRIPGLITIAAGVYGAWLVISGIRRA